MTLDDPEGKVEALLDLMDGSRSVHEVSKNMRSAHAEATETEVTEAIRSLDAIGLLEDADAGAMEPLSAWQQERYFSNLAFFDGYTNLNVSREKYQAKLLSAHVLLLGVGGLGSTLLFNLLGMGVGEVTIVDCDAVELKNLSRQYLYQESDVGQRKIDCAVLRAKGFNSQVKLNPREQRVTSARDIAEVLGDSDISLVISAIDQPREVQSWVNQACVAAGIPFIFGGMYLGTGEYCSVVPGVSGCLGCYQLVAAREQSSAQLVEKVSRVNRGIAPVASMLASFVGLEALRYLTGFAPPISAGKLICIDFATTQVSTEFGWDREAECDVCSGVLVK